MRLIKPTAKKKLRLSIIEPPVNKNGQNKPGPVYAAIPLDPLLAEGTLAADPSVLRLAANRADHPQTDLLALLHAGFTMRAPSPGPR